MAEALQRPGSQWSAVQAELEHFRKLFEFVEGVLPKDAARAMKFFTEDHDRRLAEENNLRGEEGQRRDLGASWPPMLPEFALDLHKERLQEQVDSHAADMRRELENLTTAIKGLQRDFEHAHGKIGDLTGRVSGMEHEARVHRRMGSTGSSVGSQIQQLDASGEIRLPAGDPERLLLDAVEERPSPTSLGSSGSKSPVQRASLDQGPMVSKKSLHSALEDLREDVRKWLDVLHASMLSALQQKADQENLRDIVQKVAQATAVANDSIALFAKRSISGRCASCDTPFNVDVSNMKRTPPVSLERPWPPRGSPGAQVAIRPPQEIRQVEGKAYSAVKEANRLPKISDKHSSRDFPRGKVLKNASQPDLRSLRSDFPD